MAGEKQLGNIVYEVEMNVANLIEAQQKVNQRLDQMEGGFNKTSRSASKFEGAMSKVGVAIAAAFTIETAKRLIAIGDEMNTLQARVTRLSPSIDAAKESMKALSAIASQTGNSLADTERLWESLTSSLKETGATNSQILALTSTLQKIGTIGGSSTEEMSNALRQFGQSIAGGTVRAEEFNSILEQMPELARQIATGMGISIGELRKRMLEGKLTATDALNAIQNRSQAVNDEFDKMPVSIDRAKNSLDVAFKNAISDLNQAIGLTSTLAGLMQNVADNLNYYNNNAGDAGRMPKLLELQKKYNDELKEGRKWYDFSEDDWVIRRTQAAFQLKQVEGEIAHIRAKAANDAKNDTGFKGPDSKSDSKETAKLVQNGERRLALSKLEGEARARLQAQYDAADAGLTDEKRVKALEDQYAATYKNTAAQKENNKTNANAESQTESVAQKLANLKQQSELAAGSTQDLSKEQAILRAQQSLGAAATQKDIDLAGKYAEKTWQTTAALKAQNAVPELKENASYNTQKAALESLKGQTDANGQLLLSQEQYSRESERIEQEHQNNLAKINAQATVNPVASARAEVDPVQQLVNENNQKLALMQQYQQQEQAILQQSYQKGKINYDQFVAAKAATDAQYLALKTAQENQFNEQMTAAQWQLLSQQGLGYEMLTSAVDAFSGNASNALTGLITGTMSAQDAMRSLGNTMLNSVVNSLVQVGVEALKNFIIGQTLGAASTAASVGMATTTAAAWAPAAAFASLASFGGNSVPAMTGITSTVGLASGLALTGMRYNGGPVNAGGLYQVGEKGKPEIYQASTGKQYMIPGDNGKVISNKDMTAGGGGGAPILNIYNYSPASVDAQATQNGDGSWTLEAFIADMNNGGPASSAITSNMNVKRTPRGQS